MHKVYKYEHLGGWGVFSYSCFIRVDVGQEKQMMLIGSMNVNNRLFQIEENCSL